MYACSMYIKAHIKMFVILILSMYSYHYEVLFRVLKGKICLLHVAIAKSHCLSIKVKMVFLRFHSKDENSVLKINPCTEMCLY
jgi:hypothetical protein